MTWTALDTAMARIRETIGEDPAGAREEIRQLLKTAGPSGRVRLWGLEVVACHKLGDLEGGLRAYERGRQLRASVPALAELEGQVAKLHIARRDLGSARSAADRAEALIQPFVMAPSRKSKKSKRMQRHFQHVYAAVLITRAQIAVVPGCQEELRPFDDVFEALRWIDPRNAERIHLAAVSTLGALLIQNAGRPEDLETALRLEKEAQERLRVGRVRACHPHRAQLRGVRALVLAKLGAVERAEEIFTRRVIPDLRAAGLDATADIAAEQLLWIIAERAGQEGRARLLRQRHGLPPPASAQAVVDDPADPIGF